jgi:hypothetical protein
MVNASQIKEHVEVVGSDGKHVGTVDHMEGTDKIKLTKTDKDAGGEHHYIPLAWVSSVDGDRVRLDKPAAEAERSWRTAP